VLLSVVMYRCHGYSYISLFLTTSYNVSIFSAINIAKYTSPLWSHVDVESPLAETVRYRTIDMNRMSKQLPCAEPNWRLFSYKTACIGTRRTRRISRTERSPMVILYQRYHVLENLILTSINDEIYRTLYCTSTVLLVIVQDARSWNTHKLSIYDTTRLTSMIFHCSKKVRCIRY
jgi:hypothetical protein